MLGARTYGVFQEGRSEFLYVLKEIKTGEAERVVHSFFTFTILTAVIGKSGRRICRPLRASLTSDADPIFYLTTREGELIPPKVRGNPSGNPERLYTAYNKASTIIYERI
jgi:hypothetical protein